MALQIIRDIAVFLIAIIILVGFHEYGHFITAKKCGVKVLRFSLGFGPIFYKRTGRDGCEYAFSLIPLGGYVKMLDTREGEVKPEELKYEFNSQPVWKRLAIVAAGPLFNILLAFFLFYFMFLMGVQALKPYVSNVEEDKPAYAAGLRNDDLIVRIGDTDVIDWEDVSYTLLFTDIGYLHHASRETACTADVLVLNYGYLVALEPLYIQCVGIVGNEYLQFVVKERLLVFKEVFAELYEICFDKAFSLVGADVDSDLNSVCLLLGDIGAVIAAVET